MAIALVQHTTKTGISGNPNVTFASTGAGNLLVAFADGGTNGANWTFTTPANWSALSELTQDIFSNRNGEVFYYVNNPGSITSVTFTTSVASGGWCVHFFEFSGVATASALETSGQGTPFGSGTASQAVTTTTDGDLLVAFCASNAANLSTALAGPSTGGWTNEASISDANGFEIAIASFLVQTTHGAITYTATNTGGNSDYMIAVLAFKAAAGGGTTWNQTLSDKQSALDGLTRTAAKPLADALSALDARTLATKKPLADVLSALDALAKAVAPAPLSDRFSQTDATTQVKARVQALADVLSARDTLGPLTTNKALADVLCETDALTKGVTHNQVDVVSLLDTLARQSAHYLADFFASLDAHSQSNQSGGQLLTRTLSDATSALDAVLKLPVKLTVDQFSALDQLARTRAAVLYLQDLIVETDALTKGATHVLVEGLSAMDRVAAGRALLLHLADQFGLRDAFSGATHAPTTLPQLRLLTLLVASLVQTSVALTTTPALLLLPGLLPPQVATSPSLATRLTQAFAVLPPTAATSVSILHG